MSAKTAKAIADREKRTRDGTPKDPKPSAVKAKASDKK